MKTYKEYLAEVKYQPKATPVKPPSSSNSGVQGISQYDPRYWDDEDDIPQIPQPQILPKSQPQIPPKSQPPKLKPKSSAIKEELKELFKKFASLELFDNLVKEWTSNKNPIDIHVYSVKDFLSLFQDDEIKRTAGLRKPIMVPIQIGEDINLMISKKDPFTQAEKERAANMIFTAIPKPLIVHGDPSTNDPLTVLNFYKSKKYIGKTEGIVRKEMWYEPNAEVAWLSRFMWIMAYKYSRMPQFTVDQKFYDDFTSKINAFRQQYGRPDTNLSVAIITTPYEEILKKATAWSSAYGPEATDTLLSFVIPKGTIVKMKIVGITGERKDVIETKDKYKVPQNITFKNRKEDAGISIITKDISQSYPIPGYDETKAIYYVSNEDIDRTY